MENVIKIGLPIYFIFYFGFLFIYRSLIVWKKIGKSPLVLPKNDSAQGVIGSYFKIIFIGIIVYIVLNSTFPNSTFIIKIQVLEKLNLKIIGLTLLLFSLIWTIVAQYQMKDSWRMGIDDKSETKLIKKGLFKISRNPIFFGLIISFIGLFLMTPNVITLIILTLGVPLIQIQIRLEEEFLLKLHKEDYNKYKIETRRFI